MVMIGTSKAEKRLMEIYQ